jgi:hypothetical protein
MNFLQPLAIGVVLALGVSAYARWIGFDRDRAFYPTVVIVIAFYYVLFSAMSGNPSSMIPEISIASLFVAAASLGFRRNMWLVVGALAAHGILDAFHGALVVDPGVPQWWPPFCMAYDLTAAGVLAVLLRRDQALSKVRAGNRPSV